MSSVSTDVFAGELILNITEFPSDTNSLFSVLASHQYMHELSQYHQENLIYYVTLLRGICSVYITPRLSDPVLRSQLIRTCRLQFSNWEEELLVAEFLRKLPVYNGARGGEECLESLSVQLLLRINVYTRDGLKRSFPCGGFHSGYHGEVNLLESEGLHFDNVNSVRSSVHSELFGTFSSNETSTPLFVTIPAQDIHFQNPPQDSVEVRSEQVLQVGTWNVRGGNRSVKRDSIDTEIQKQGLDLVCLQELRMSSGVIYTRHYKWYVNAHNPSRTCRGTAIMVRKFFVPHIRSFSSISQNICVLTFKIGEKMLALVCFHSPSEGAGSACREYVRLSDTIRKYSKRHEILILGDWNAHLGFGDREPDDLRVGPILQHYETNENGRMMRMLVELHNLEVMSTKLDRTCKVTWQRGLQKSQIDHVLRQLNSSLFVFRMKGLWKESLTDHKLLMCRIKFESDAASQILPRLRPQFQSTKRKWDLSLLKNEETLGRYQESLSEIQHLIIFA